MATTCPNCSIRFSKRDALCHDWNDPQRSFGCPSCNTFYIKKKTRHLSQQTRIGIIVGGVMAPAMWIFWRGVVADEPQLTVYAGIIIVSILLIGVYSDLPWNRDLTQSPYQPDSASTPEDQSQPVSE